MCIKIKIHCKHLLMFDIVYRFQMYLWQMYKILLVILLHFL